MNEEFQKVLEERPHLRLGKKGVTSNVLEHIKQLLKHNKMVKIKVLPDTAKYVGMEPILTEIIKNLKVYLLDVRGFTFIISKRKIPDITIPKKYKKLVIDAQKDNSKQKALKSVEEEKIEPGPAYIDYDNEELLEEIDAASDEIYGAPPEFKPKQRSKKL